MTESKADTQNVFKQFLLQSPEGIRYCKERGITKKNVEDGLVGLCPAAYAYRFPLLQGRLTVTIKDAHGNIVAFAGRQADWLTEFVERQYLKQAKLEDAHKFIVHWNRIKWVNEPYDKRFHLFNLDAAKDNIRSKNYAIIVEGYLDSIIAHNYGMRNVVATCGTALTEYQIALLSRYCDNIVVMYDTDANSAGQIACESAIKKIEKRELNGFGVQLPLGTDPDDIIMKYGKDKLEAAIDNLVYKNEKKILRVKG